MPRESQYDDSGNTPGLPDDRVRTKERRAPPGHSDLRGAPTPLCAVRKKIRGPLVSQHKEGVG